MRARDRFAVGAAVSLASLLAPVATAATKPPLKVTIGIVSQQISPARAQVSASITARAKTPGRSATAGVVRAGPSAQQAAKLRAAHPTSTVGGARPKPPALQPPTRPKKPAAPAGPVYPSLPADSPFFANPKPFGPTSFWYAIPGGVRCVYLPYATPLCFLVIPGGGRVLPPRPRIDPGAIAVSAVARLGLGPGRIEASPAPAAAGLTGVDSWFWLAPAPQVRVLTLSVAGERVTVRARPAGVEWRFGDGASERGGAGVAYRPGGAPAGAVRHRYETRCLPGDQGRGFVLASCARAGYIVAAVIVWEISYTASGPVRASGTLPTRTTATSIGYPVSEARAFLTAGGR